MALVNGRAGTGTQVCELTSLVCRSCPHTVLPSWALTWTCLENVSMGTAHGCQKSHFHKYILDWTLCNVGNSSQFSLASFIHLLFFFHIISFFQLYWHITFSKFKGTLIHVYTVRMITTERLVSISNWHNYFLPLCGEKI